MSQKERGFGFASEHDAPIAYMQRIRDYYLALGYATPYRWAHYAEVPFRPLTKPLDECRVALITTAAPYQPGKGDQGPGAPYNAAAKFYSVYSRDSSVDHDLRISHLAIDRIHTTAEDSNTWFPLPQLRRCAAAGRIGAVAPRFPGAPTNRSHRTTLKTGLPRTPGALLRRRCRRRNSRRQLTGVSPDRESGRPAFGGERHRHGRDGVRQGHRGICRRAALPVQRFPTGQRRGTAEGPAIPGLHPGACPTRP
jgi:hypothetical protein